jgi:hypothetical protein
MKKLAVVAGLVLLSACGSPVSQDSRDLQAKPINCADAKEDIKALEAEKASVLKRMGAGAQFVIPVAVVVNIFQEGSGNDAVKDKNSVASGEYNKALDAKIAEIKSTCNV